MKTLCRTVEAKTEFVLAEVDPHQDIVRGLGFAPVAGGFAKAFPSDAPRLHEVYQQFAASAEAIVLQAAGVQPVPWEQALHAFIERTRRAGLGADTDWWLGGSAALAVRGIGVTPRDLDVIVGEQDAHRVGEALADALVQPVEDAGDWICRWFGRAYLHCRIEWIGGAYGKVDEPHAADFGPSAGRCLETVSWHGHDLRVPPLSLQIQASRRRGLEDRVRKIEAHIVASP